MPPGSGETPSRRIRALAISIVSLPFMTPARLAHVASQGWEKGWERLLRGQIRIPSTAKGRELPFSPGRSDVSEIGIEWARLSRAMDPDALLGTYEASGVRVHLLGEPDYPAVLAEDPSAPLVIFSSSDVPGSPGRCAAVIGTRSATPYGISVAQELGESLSGAGVCVVSGLALGIDGAAHVGALRANGTPPLAIVGSGLDVVYPPKHRRLWREVAQRGAVMSESPLGARPLPWRFPWRNRLLAAASDVVVVVECHRGGGSLSTVEAAARRGVPVLAVPGPVNSSASEGTNALLADGCAPARDVTDVLSALALSGEGGLSKETKRSEWHGSSAEGSVLEALGPMPTTLQSVQERCGLGLAEVAVTLERLVSAGEVVAGDGWWARR